MVISSSTTTTTLNLSLSLSLHSTTSSNTISSRPKSSLSFRSLSRVKLKFQILRAASKSKNSYSDGDDDENQKLWLREEQRWLREEERWLREESRWRAERESLIRQISEMKLKIQTRQLDHRNMPVSDSIANLSAMLQVLKDVESGSSVGRIAESGSSASPMVLEATNDIGKEEKAAVVVKDIKVVETSQVDANKVKRKAIKKGLEGEDVRLMQEALLKLGFYSGEEDMEYSSFSTGTERAVKTWQASLDLPEDGIMTVDLLELLYADEPVGAKTVKSNMKENDFLGPTQGVNGNASITEKSEVQHRTVKGKAITEVDVTKPRVFLLGENRWEEPSRLIGRDTLGGRSKTSNHTPKCPACQGEGRILCMECDGTGEPNIEEQFMEWVDEGAKCPYCDGLGDLVCDLCGVKTTI